VGDWRNDLFRHDGVEFAKDRYRRIAQPVIFARARPGVRLDATSHALRERNNGPTNFVGPLCDPT
jgi:hypothetical protein